MSVPTHLLRMVDRYGENDHWIVIDAAAEHVPDALLSMPGPHRFTRHWYDGDGSGHRAYFIRLTWTSLMDQAVLETLENAGHTIASIEDLPLVDTTYGLAMMMQGFARQHPTWDLAVQRIADNARDGIGNVLAPNLIRVELQHALNTFYTLRDNERVRQSRLAAARAVDVTPSEISTARGHSQMTSFLAGGQ